MPMILWQVFWMRFFLPIVPTSTSHVMPVGITLPETESHRRGRLLEVDNQQELEEIHLHRVDGVDPFANRRRAEDHSWLQQGQSAFIGNSTCRPFAEIRKTMEELHARAKETLLELIAALGRMQAQTQLEKAAIDNLIEARKTSNKALSECEQQKATALDNAEKYGNELKELQQIAQADAAIFNITGTGTKTSLIQESVSGDDINMPAVLLQWESQNLKRLGATDEVDKGIRHISLAEAHHTELNNVQEAAKALQDCLTQTGRHRLSVTPTVGPTESPEKCASHKERLKKMFATAYAHIASVKEKYEDLADDDSCDKAAHEEFGGREGQLNEELNATRRHLCSVHKTMTELTQDANKLKDQANAIDNVLQETGCALPACAAAKEWPVYHGVILEVASTVNKHPACAKCCQNQNTESLLQAEQQQNSLT